MPIRFRCAYCNQLMGIAHRKAGTVVRCPTCGGQVVVPHPNQEAAPQALQQVAGVFENADFDKVLQQGPAAPHRPASPVPGGGSAGNVASVDVEPFLATGLPEESGGLSLAKFLLIAVVLFVLLGLAFLGGFLVGRSSVVM